MRNILTPLLLVVASLSFAQVGISETLNFEPNKNVSGNIRNNDNSPVMLDVDGSTRVRDMPTAKADTYSPVVRNNNTGVLEVLSQNVNSVKPFNYLTVRIDNPNDDYVQALNTKINANRYSVAIIGHRFLNEKGGTVGLLSIGRNSPREKARDNQNSTVANLSNEIALNKVGSEAIYNRDYQEEAGWSKWDVQVSANVYADINNSNQWVLHADYAGAGAKFWGDGNGYWEINLLVIDNNFVNVLNPVDINLNGNSSGSLSSPPAGLGL